MTLGELQRALTSVQPAAVLVPPRVMEHVVRHSLQLSPMTWSVPHTGSWVAERTVLYRYVDHAELPLAPEQLLPNIVVLLAWPDEDHLLRTPPAAVFLQMWRQLFHASVHQALHKLWKNGTMTPARLRDRIEAIGPTAFEEIRGVLVTENLLLAKASDVDAFDEFAAFFLELRHFAPALVPTYFPGLGDPSPVQTLLDELVDSTEILQKTRLPGAPDPRATAPRRSEANEYFHELEVSAEDAERRGNLVDAAIELQRAVRVAPSDQTRGTEARADAILDKLLQRVTVALELPEAEVAGWKRLLPILLDKADQGNRPAEAALLYDLQNICIAHEREIYRLDVFEWLLSAGKRPLRRPLPSQRLVRITRTLRGAVPSLTSARLSDEDRAELESLLKQPLERSEEAVRDRFRPVLDGAFRDVGLSPRDALETIAFRKMIEELLDRLLDDGFFTFSDLRDTISRNQLKLPDLSDPQDFLRGDALIRLDRRLASALDGVYRSADFYLRWLERFTSFNFGTPVGRMLTLLLTIPILGSVLVVEIIDVLGGLLVKHVFDAAPAPIEAPAAAAVPADAATEAALDHAAAAHAEGWMSTPLHWSLLVLFAVTIFGLLHSQALRHRFRDALRALGRGLWFLFVDLPIRAVKHDAVERILTGWPFQLLYGYVLLPAVLTLVLTLFLPHFRHDWVRFLLAFLAMSCLVNTRPGKAAWETFVGAVVGLFELFRSGLVLGLFRFIVRLYKRIAHAFESMFFAIDEWLRFRGGESRGEIALRTVLTLVWAPISFVIRFVLIVFIEPCFNPLKLPICLIAAKLMVPLWPTIVPSMSHWLTPILGVAVTGIVIGNIVIWSPDAFGFIFWELKENWFLYRANRLRSVEPIGVGPHGETVRGLFQPGFHSGTLPKLFGAMRKAELRALRTENYSPVRTAKAKRHHVEEAIARFVARECGYLLERTPAWHGRTLHVSGVELASNRLRCRLHPAESATSSEPLVLTFDYRETWIVAHLETPSWFAALDREALSALHNTLVRLYRLAEVDLIVEHVDGLITTPGERFDVKRDGLTLWTPDQPAVEVNLRIRPDRDAPISTWDPRHVLFSRRPLSRDACSSAWPIDPKEAVPLLLGDVQVFRWPTPSPSPSQNGDTTTAEGNGVHAATIVPQAAANAGG
jgi:hypothetical protein